MNFLKQILLIVAFFLLNDSLYAASPQPLQVVRVTPSRVNVPEAGQIIIEFNKPMAKLGKSAPQEWPIILSPEVKGKWIWLNNKTLSLNIEVEKGLKKATKYTIVIKPGLKSLDQSTLEQKSTHEFVTSLPQPRWFEIKTWETPTRPVIRGSFDQAVQKDSLEKHLFFVEKNDKSKKTPVRLTCDESDEKGQPTPGLKVARYWIVEAAKDLDLNKEYQLSLEAGLLTEEGTEPGESVDSLLAFKTFDDFKFVGFRCRLNKATKDDKPVVFTEASPQKEGQACDPLKPIELLFTAPVMRSQLKHNMVLSPDPTHGDKEINIWGDDEDYSQLSNASNISELYPVRLPYGLKAATEYGISVKLLEASWWKKLGQKIIHLSKKPPKTDLHDEFGRALTDAFSLTIKLDDRKPNFVIAHHNAILEKQVNSDVPLYVNNLKSATLTCQVLTSKDLLKSQVMTYEIPNVRNVQFAIPFNLRKLLGGESGVVYGSLETSPKVDKGGYEDEERTLFAQVTPYQVQVKVGHFNTLIWVTDLATGAVVSDAKVTIYPGVLHELKRPEAILGSGITDANGVAILEGQEKIDPKRKFAYGWGKNTEKLFVLVEKADEMALLPLTSSFEIDTYRASGEKFWSSVNQKYEYLTSWGTTAQGAYRAGDKVQYKFYIRNQDNNHFVPPPLGRYDLEITDPTNKVVHEIKDISLNKFGAFDGEFTVSKNGGTGMVSI